MTTGNSLFWVSSNWARVDIFLYIDEDEAEDDGAEEPRDRGDLSATD